MLVVSDSEAELLSASKPSTKQEYFSIGNDLSAKALKRSIDLSLLL